MLVNLVDEAATIALATQAASCLATPIILTFHGEIGAGKTTFIRAFLKALGVQGAIKSPTFSLVETYTLKHFNVHHFDLYRIHDEIELEYIGFRDYFSGQDTCCIEWPERAMGYLSHADVAFYLSMRGAGRQLDIRSSSPAGDRFLTCLTSKS